MKNSSPALTAAILGALAHRNRLRILEYLGRDVRCNCEIAPALGLEQSNLSRHLKLLVEAGILRSWRDGLRVNFRIADERIFTIIATAASIGTRAADPTSRRSSP